MLRDEKFAEIVFAFAHLPPHLAAISERFAPAAAEIIANPDTWGDGLPACKALSLWLRDCRAQFPKGSEGESGFIDAAWYADEAICLEHCMGDSVRSRLNRLVRAKDIAVRSQLLHAAEEKEAGHPLVAETTPTETEEENNGND